MAEETKETDLQELLEKDRMERLEKCKNEIEGTLNCYRCRISPRLIITQNSYEFGFDLYAE